MDPIALIFASYIEAVSDRAYAQMHDETGSEVQAVVVAHNNYRITYQYQYWEVLHDSVCADRDKVEDITNYSKCTIAAKSLFERACRRLEQKPEEHWKYNALLGMYCAAADNYTPTIATIDWSYEQETQLSVARRECSAAVAAAIGSRDPRVLNERDVKCRRYEQIKKQYGEF